MGHGARVFRRHAQSQPLETSPFANNPLVASVPRENVTVRGRRAIIPLWPHWNRLLEEAQAFGRVLSISRNSHAVLGRIMTYPGLERSARGHGARSVDGAMEFHFSRWNRAAVTVGEADGGWFYAVEFQDAMGEILHKICLTDDSDFEAFRDWVEANQAITVENLREPETRDAGGEEGGIPAGEQIFLQRAVLKHLFGRLIGSGRGVHLVVGNGGFVQGADLRPGECLERGQWIFVSDADCGLHLRHERLAEICLQRVHWGEDVLVLKAYEPEGRLACVIAPSQESNGRKWDDFLLRSVEAFQLRSRP